MTSMLTQTKMAAASSPPATVQKLKPKFPRLECGHVVLVILHGRVASCSHCVCCRSTSTSRLHLHHLCKPLHLHRLFISIALKNESHDHCACFSADGEMASAVTWDPQQHRVLPGRLVEEVRLILLKLKPEPNKNKQTVQEGKTWWGSTHLNLRMPSW